MKVAIIGTGSAGLAAKLALEQKGHEIVVIDKEDAKDQGFHAEKLIIDECVKEYKSVRLPETRRERRARLRKIKKQRK